MILVNKGNFFVRTFIKRQDSVTAPQNAFYADFKICLVLEGKATWEIEGHSYKMQAGDIVFLRMGQKRHFTSFGEHGFKFCSFTLKRNAFSGQHHFVYFLERIKKQGSLMRNSALSELLKAFYMEWETESILRYELASAALTTFFIKAERSEGYALQSLSEDHGRMLEIMDYIDTNIGKESTLRMVAQKAGMSESALSRRFSQMNGISFKEYVIEKKIQRAITLLQSTNRKVIDISLECGFDSISGFYSAFRKKTGTTPSKFSEFEN